MAVRRRINHPKNTTFRRIMAGQISGRCNRLNRHKAQYLQAFEANNRQCCQGNWRLGSESNRRTRSCSPLHDHSATEPYWGVGAGNRVRTGDLNLGKVALYQLSYSRTTNDYPPPWSLELMRLLAPPQPMKGCAQLAELFPHTPVASKAHVRVALIVCTASTESSRIQEKYCNQLN